MRFLRHALTGLVLLSLTLGLLAYAALLLQSALQAREGREADARPGRGEQVFAANVVTVEPDTITPVQSSFGVIRARRNLEIRAPAPGRIVEMGETVEDGGRVTEGALLFVIDPAEAQTALRLARADLADATAETEDARRALDLAAEDVAAAREQAKLREAARDRQSGLEGRGVGTEAAVEDAKLAAASARQQVVSRLQAEAAAAARRNQAEIQLDRARIALADAERRLADTRIEAAFDGAISELAVTLGGLVGQNERLADLIDPDALEIAFRISTADYMRLLDPDGRLAARDAEVSLELGGIALTSPATIIREAAAVGDGESGRRLFARIEAPGGFRPGDFATIRIAEPALAGVTRLPAAALAPNDTLLVLDASDRLSAAPVERLRSQGDEVIVRAPDLAGREVVAQRSPLLGPGIKVRPLRQATETTETAAAVGDRIEMLEITPERRAALIALVESDAAMPEAAKARVLAQLRDGPVPAHMVERLEGARGG